MEGNEPNSVNEQPLNNKQKRNKKENNEVHLFSK